MTCSPDAMKVPISDYALVDLDAPVLPAYEAVIEGVTHWVVWCKYCQVWHQHGAAEGHREAHCTDSASGYRPETAIPSGNRDGRSPVLSQ
jgi:hypothetical protein